MPNARVLEDSIATLDSGVIVCAVVGMIFNVLTPWMLLGLLMIGFVPIIVGSVYNFYGCYASTRRVSAKVNV